MFAPGRPESQRNELAGEASIENHPVALGVLASLLKTGKCIDHASSVMLLCTMFFVLQRPDPIGFFPSVLIGMLQKYFAWRVAFDAELFAVLSQAPSETATLDGALVSLFGKKKVRPNRSMQSRWSGAKSLLVWQASCAMAQFALLLYLAVMLFAAQVP